MYEEFYGLHSKPFSLLPDADFLFLSKRHKTVLNLLQYAMDTQAGFVVITGEVGAGKTTIIRRFLKNADKNITLGVVTNASTVHEGLLNWVLTSFGLPHTEQDYVTLYNRFVSFLLSEYGAGRRTVLIIDEAQNLSMKMLEDLRMLSNVNNERDQLLQIILVGQPELLTMLKQPELRQFGQRIAVHYHLEPLSGKETGNYIHHRLSFAGASTEIFDDLACATVHYFTGGVPRLINLLCDIALVYGFAEEVASISFDLIVDVVDERGRGGLTPFNPIPEGIDRAKLKDAIAALALSDSNSLAIGTPSLPPDGPPHSYY